MNRERQPHREGEGTVGAPATAHPIRDVDSGVWAQLGGHRCDSGGVGQGASAREKYVNITIVRAAATQWRLSMRETEVLAGIVIGLTDRSIASRLGLSPRTVSDHVRSLLAKAHTANRTGLTSLALQLNTGAP